MKNSKITSPFLVLLLSNLCCQFYTPAYSQIEVSFPKVDKIPLSHLPSPVIGKLADIDPALIVTPPMGMEAGYVPIVTRQALAK